VALLLRKSLTALTRLFGPAVSALVVCAASLVLLLAGAFSLARAMGWPVGE
jgi:hypothetical protein